MSNFVSYKNWVNEKFTDESDPITDMGIGAVKHFEEIFELFAKEDKLKYIYTIAPYDDKHIDFWFNNPNIKKLTKRQRNKLFDYVKNIIYYKLGFSQILTNPILIKGYEDSDLKIGSIPMIVRFSLNNKFRSKLRKGEYRRVEPFKDKIEFYQHVDSVKYERDVKLRTFNESVNEKFTQDSDPVHDLGIGSRKIIEKWIQNIKEDHPGGNFDPFEDYTIDEHLKINVHQYSYLPDNCGDLPEYINFGKIDNSFSVTDCDLTTLRGMPEYVERTFLCTKNKLTSLKYAPKIVGGDFDCRDNSKQFTKEDVKAVCKVRGDIIV